MSAMFRVEMFWLDVACLDWPGAARPLRHATEVRCGARALPVVGERVQGTLTDLIGEYPTREEAFAVALRVREEGLAEAKRLNEAGTPSYGPHAMITGFIDGEVFPYLLPR